MKTLKLNKTKLLIGAAILATPIVSNAGLLNVSDMRGEVKSIINPNTPSISGEVDPKILAGGNPGDLAPVVPAGEFTGVVSINTRYEDGGSFICTGTVISKRHVVTAAHCLDNPDGSAIDISNPNQDVRVVFNDGGDWFTGSSAESLVTAVEVIVHPDYAGFGICGPGDTPGFGTQCLGDDIAIVTLPTDIPEGVEIHEFYRGGEELSGDQIWKMVGHGTGGNGIDGDNAPPDFFVKRFGFNIPELFECDDETVTQPGGYTNTAACAGVGSFGEVWRADFDGVDADGILQDFFCAAVNVCGPILGNDFNAEFFEANIGGGDSGGPSFVFNEMSGKYELIGNNTFGSGDGSFGSGFGGNIYAPYLAWIDDIVSGMQQVSAPAGIAILLAPLALMGLRRRIRS